MKQLCLWLRVEINLSDKKKECKSNLKIKILLKLSNFKEINMIFAFYAYTLFFSHLLFDVGRFYFLKDKIRKEETQSKLKKNNNVNLEIKGN